MSHSRKTIRRSIKCCGVLLALAAAWPALAADPPLDADISYWVREALRDDPRVDAAAITVSAQKGAVTLTGTVRSLASRKAAVAQAKRINGVVGVLDKLSLEPVWRSDTDLAQDVRHRIVNDAAIESSNIRVMASGGKVTLLGSAATRVEADQAELVASEVRGVREVVNDIAVEYRTTRTDQEIKNDTVAYLEQDVYLRGLPITVAVSQGNVKLTGTVHSLYERDQAARAALRVSHVKGVQNELKVDTTLQHGVRGNPPILSDTQLKENVLGQLKRDIRVDASKIEVKADGGHLTLSGSVPYGDQKRIAAEDARDTVGASWITDNVMVVAPPRADASIRADVDFDMETDYLLSGMNIDVGVNKGIVKLSGTVLTTYERNHAATVAWRTRGVKEVVNSIEIAHDPKFNDVTLERKLRSSLLWDWTTHWVRDEIDVDVDHGVAHLRGHVDTWAERAEAGRLAMHTPGIWRVHNYLRVGQVPYSWDEWDDYYDDWYYPY